MISIGEIKEKYKEQLTIDLLDLLKKYDPSSQNKSSQFKYTKWLVSCTDEIENLKKLILNEFTDWLENDFKQDCASFDELVKEGFIKGDDSDIFKFKSVEDFNKVLEAAKQQRELKRREKEFHKYFEDEEYMIGTPLTYEASLTYGSNTKWCTASKDTSNHFYTYSKNVLIYFISKKNHQKETFGIYLQTDKLDSNLSSLDTKGKKFTAIQKYIEFWNVQDVKTEVKDVVFGNRTKEMFIKTYESVIEHMSNRPNIKDKK
jgi:hypothetical protein